MTSKQVDKAYREYLDKQSESRGSWHQKFKPDEALFIEDLPTELADEKFNVQQQIDTHEHSMCDSKCQQLKQPVKFMRSPRKCFTVIGKPKQPPKPKLRKQRARRETRVQTDEILRCMVSSR